MVAKSEMGKYAVVPEWVCTCLSSDALHLYVYLAINAWGDQGWKIGRKQMMYDLGFGRTKVTALLNELAKFKAITIKNNVAPGGGKGWNTYIVNTTPPRLRRADEGRQGDPGVCRSGDPGVCRSGDPGYAAAATQGGPQRRPSNTDTRTQMKGDTSPKAPSGGKRAECSVCGIFGVVGVDVHRVSLHQPRAGRRTHYVHPGCDPQEIVRTGSLRPSFRGQDGDDPYKLK